MSVSVRPAILAHCHTHTHTRTRDSLQLLAQVLEHHEANEGADEGNEEIEGRHNVVEGEGEGFAIAVDAGEFAHKQVRVKEEDDKGDFDDHAPHGPETGSWSERRHGAMITAKPREPKRNRMRWRPAPMKAPEPIIDLL